MGKGGAPCSAGLHGSRSQLEDPKRCDWTSTGKRGAGSFWQQVLCLKTTAGPGHPWVLGPPPLPRVEGTFFPPKGQMLGLAMPSKKQCALLSLFPSCPQWPGLENPREQPEHRRLHHPNPSGNKMLLLGAALVCLQGHG